MYIKTKNYKFLHKKKLNKVKIDIIYLFRSKRVIVIILWRIKINIFNSLYSCCMFFFCCAPTSTITSR